MLAIAATGFVALLVSAAAANGKSRPHLIFVMADDQGWNNAGFHNPNLLTPHTNALVEEGVRLNRHYVYKFCSPTRCSVLSGRLPIHVNQENSATEQPLAGIPINMTAFPARLREVGYATHQIGKWHAGQASASHIPTGAPRGFDTALSFFNFGEDHYTQRRGGQALAEMDLGATGNCPTAVDLYASHGPAHGMNGTYGGFLFTAEAVKRIESHDPATPLFMYIAFQNVHPPLQVPVEYTNRYSGKNRTTINGMVSFLDESLGNVTAALKRRGLWEDTLLVYSPDNGGYQGQGGDDTPNRGGKFSDFEGGVRVAAFATGGVLPKAVRGKSVDGMISIADWYATFCALAGVVDVTDKRAAAAGLPPLDSVDVSALLLGTNMTSPRSEIVLSAFKDGLVPQQGRLGGPRYFGKGEGVVAGPDADGKLWKLIVGTQLSGPFGPAHHLNSSRQCQDTNSTAPIWTSSFEWGPGNTGVDCTCGTGCLYELFADETESFNVAAKHPIVLQDMQARLERARATVYAPPRGDLDPAACTANDRNGGFWSPWLPDESVLV